MSRLSLAALIFAFAAFAIGAAAPVLDPAVLEQQLALARRVAAQPEPVEPTSAEREPGFREEAGRWIARKIRERNARAEADESRAASPGRETGAGLFGAAAPYLVPLQYLLALAGLGFALVDWLRTRALRRNATAGVVALGALLIPFAWGAIGVAMGVVGAFVAILLVMGLLGAIAG
ncbi:hypothetical protein [Methylopila sp. M107]|uniref:hypothetical protein n=1 Tax=Methylopila sp. M107 TaxID=1101190 RepID=UPI00038194E0|nr:hypothetical protein [Methylopila sp. M107]